MRKYNLSSIMKTAWELVKNFGKKYNFSSALKSAWAMAKDAAEKADFSGEEMMELNQEVTNETSNK